MDNVYVPPRVNETHPALESDVAKEGELNMTNVSDRKAEHFRLSFAEDEFNVSTMN